MAYIFTVKYSVLFGLFNFGLGLGLINLASALTSASRLWPRPQPRPQDFGLDLDLGLKCLTSASSLASIIWPRLTSLDIIQLSLVKFLKRTDRTTLTQDVCLSVRPSHACIVLKRLSIILKHFYKSGSHTILVFCTKRYGDIPTGSP